MSKLVLLAALIAAAVDDRPVVPEVATDARYQCWSAWRVEFDAELVITEPGVGAPEFALPAADAAEAGSFTGAGWTYGNLFDDLDDTGCLLGPADYGGVEWSPFIDVDEEMSFAVSMNAD